MILEHEKRPVFKTFIALFVIGFFILMSVSAESIIECWEQKQMACIHSKSWVESWPYIGVIMIFPYILFGCIFFVTVGCLTKKNIRRDPWGKHYYYNGNEQINLSSEENNELNNRINMSKRSYRKIK